MENVFLIVYTVTFLLMCLSNLLLVKRCNRVIDQFHEVVGWLAAFAKKKEVEVSPNDQKN